ncbi:MAG TPA: L,D-transpeptidase family protein, partial [Patescibacteria group bacterium]|nr:L,D-transpeptidase family protein [Patescibacteria group bacterium]
MRFSVSPASLLRAIAMTAILLAADGAVAAQSAAPPDPAALEIQHRLAEVSATPRLHGEAVELDALRGFYRSRQWRPAWTDTADKVVAVLSTAELEGLPPGPMHLPAIAALRGANTAASQADSDLLISDALLHYAAAMRGQRADPTVLEDDWFIPTPSFDAVAFLKEHAANILPALQTLQPPYAGYQQLRAQLARLRAIAAAGDWPKVPTGPSIKPGAVDDRITAVRTRLIATGELSAVDAAGITYDENLQAAVQLFQQRHGLNDDAVLGKQTVATMNASATEIAHQVAVNMERWRWLPPKLEDNHIVVNVAAAQLEVVENGRAVLTMRTIVGDPDHPTPALHARLTQLVLNPTWSVPSSIATKEILPKLKKDPGYLVANDLEIISDAFPPGSPESQGIGIDWKARQSFPWQLRQRPGSDNALGRIKFAIPNDDDIYLHDTPNHHLFSRSNRALSHGCVRLDKPDDLALYLLKDRDWTAQK